MRRLSRRLSWLLIGIMVLAITFTIGYSILFIRDYMFRAEQQKMHRLARHMLSRPDGDKTLQPMVRAHGYRLQLLDTPLPSRMWETDEHLYAQYSQHGRTVRLQATKAHVLDQLRPIRWIIYQAMFITVGLVVLASVFFAVAVTRPIVRIKNVLEKLADRSPELLERDSKRKDEIGMIVRALNHVSRNLRQDNVRLKQLYERQGRFYQDVAHELNNPLHALSGAVEMLELQIDDVETRQQYLAVIRRHQQRMAALVKDILALQNSELDQLPLRPEQIALRPLIEGRVADFQDAFARKGIRLRMEAPDAETQVWADPDALLRILENLLSNALKYTERGEVAMGARLQQGGVELYVQDTGLGISAEHLPLLTERFYRVDTDRSREKGGTGLGLSIVASLLRQMESELQVRSEPGVGSTFSFVLPIAS
ncbi:MAG: ATP-binding protein [Bacteroidetes bacterium]|nr:ATP-binding protein [Bacteroidota bacterium]